MRGAFSQRRLSNQNNGLQRRWRRRQRSLGPIVLHELLLRPQRNRTIRNRINSSRFRRSPSCRHKQLLHSLTRAVPRYPPRNRRSSRPMPRACEQARRCSCSPSSRRQARSLAGERGRGGVVLSITRNQAPGTSWMQAPWTRTIQTSSQAAGRGLRFVRSVERGRRLAHLSTSTRSRVIRIPRHRRRSRS